MRHSSAQMRSQLATLAGVIALIAAAHCARTDNSNSGAHGSANGAAGGSAAGTGSPVGAANGGAAAPAQCKRAQGLDGPGAPRDSCTSAAAYLKCEYSGGVTGFCLSDDPTRCPQDLAVVGGSAKSCQNQCQPNEYAVGCGAVGPNIGSAAPPAGCRSLGVTPAGPRSFCCPCL